MKMLLSFQVKTGAAHLVFFTLCYVFEFAMAKADKSTVLAKISRSV